MQSPLALVVDDDRGVREVVGDLLRKIGAKVLVAPEANEALGILKQQPIDVLFTDLCLPGLDGIGVLQEALKLRPDVATVILTGYASLESSIDVLRLGACDYVTKPITPQKINWAWTRVLETRRRVSTVRPVSQSQVVRGDDAPCELVARSDAMRQILNLVARVARTAAPVMIYGESGVGKNLVAKTIHRQSARVSGPFVRVNCSAISQDLSESDWFGHERGSFPAADQQRRGLLEQAKGGTLFLEGAEELSLRAQAQLLNALEAGHFHPIGRVDPLAVDVRVIAATTADLESAVAQGHFRRALYDELSVVTIRIPPLRYRTEDLRALAQLFLDRSCEGQGSGRNGSPLRFSQEAWDYLLRYDWPGNVRELANFVGQAVLLTEGDEMGLDILPERMRRRRHDETVERLSVPLTGDLKEIERTVVEEVIERCNGNKTAAARALGMHRRTLYRMLERGTNS